MGSVDTNDWCISFQCFYQIKLEINNISQLSNIFVEDSLNWSLIPGRSLRLSDSQKNVPGIKSMISVEPRFEKAGLRGLTRSDTNRTVQPQKMAKGLKFRI